MAGVRGTIRPLHDKVIVTDMNFGETRSNGGIVVLGDDGKDRGIHPRWAKVFAVGPEHNEEYGVGDWILMEHGRWTRGIKCEHDDGTEYTVRMIYKDCVMMWSDEEPKDMIIGHL